MILSLLHYACSKDIQFTTSCEVIRAATEGSIQLACYFVTELRVNRTGEHKLQSRPHAFN